MGEISAPLFNLQYPTHCSLFFYTYLDDISFKNSRLYYVIINSLKKKKETEDDPHEQFGSSDLTKDSAMNTHH